MSQNKEIMRKIYLFLLLPFLISSCDYIPMLKKKNETIFVPDSFYTMPPIDTLQLTLEALQNKPIIRGFKQEGGLQVDSLYYVGFSVTEQDLDVFHFVNENDEEFLFDRNDTRWKLIKKSDYPTLANRGLVANPDYLTKQLLVIWRNISLVKEELNDHEYIDEKIREIVYLKEIYKEIETQTEVNDSIEITQ